jgi:hypothetical protein
MISFFARAIFDTFMAYHLFHGKPKYFNFLTMIPYIIAQGGIIFRKNTIQIALE